MDNQQNQKKNMLFYPIGTIGRDMMYSLVNNYLLTYILFTKSLTNAQLGAVTAIMVAARIFDGLNDPIMGNIIERTRTKWGKFKPWLFIGIITSAIVIYMVFNSSLTGWSFIWLFGFFYFSFSITYTMHDISYWGMIPALGSDADARNQYTSKATLCGGFGGTLASILIPLLTTGAYAIGGSANIAYGRVALVICVLGIIFLMFTIFGVRENRDDLNKEAPPFSFKKVIKTITGNDQLMWIAIIFFCQQIGTNIILGGMGSTYLYVTFGYKGSLYSLFTTIGMAATAFLMIFYPSLSRKIHRKPLMKIMVYIAVTGYALMLVPGLLLPATNLKYWCLVIGYMLSNFGQYCFYLIMMISIINTVEYNEYIKGTRDEAIISSLRPFITKMASALVAAIVTVSYMIFGITSYTNQVSQLESAAAAGTITEAEKLTQISSVLSGVQASQANGLLIVMTVLPCFMFLLSYFLYLKHYKLDEEEYDRICNELEKRKSGN